MEAIGITELRKNMKMTLDKVVNDHTEIIVHRPNSEDVVMVSLSEYNSMKETLLLLSSKTNRERLLRGVQEVKDGKTKEINIDEL